MRYRTNFFKAIVLAICFIPVVASAQVVKKAQVGFRFLENPVAAEVIGRGSVGVATTFSCNGIFWNPSLLGWVTPTTDVSLGYTKGIADINYSSLAGAVRLGDFGVIGVSLLMMDYGTFEGTRRAANADGYIRTGSFSPNAYAAGVAFSQKVSDRFSYGVHVKYIRQDLGSAFVASSGASIDDPALVIAERAYATSAVAADVGAFYDFHYSGIRFGAVLRNISRELKYENERFPLPFAVSFGTTVNPLELVLDDQDAKNFLLSFESYHPRDFNEKVKVGGEYKLMGMLSLRAGYMFNYDERGLTAGIGVESAEAGLPLRVDYAFEPFGVFGTVHHFSLSASY
jgi:hypothetical protein